VTLILTVVNGCAALLCGKVKPVGIVNDWVLHHMSGRQERGDSQRWNALMNGVGRVGRWAGVWPWVWPGVWIILSLCSAGAPAKAQESPATTSGGLHKVDNGIPSTPRASFATGTHRFWDKTNLGLFGGVTAVRALDFTSTQHFRERGHSEVLLSNSIVDNKPLYATIESAGVAASIGLAYCLHRTGHHRLERWTSIVHIGVASVGDVHNYLLRRSKN